MGAPIDEWILISILLHNLDSKYKEFIHRMITQLEELPDFDRIITLLHEEERLLSRDSKKQAITAQIRRFQKEQEEKNARRNTNTNNSNSNRGGRSSRGRGGGTNSQNNNNSGRPSKNPNSTWYKGDGDLPECSKCPTNFSGNKRRHWPYDCYTLHPEKAPEGYRNRTNNNTNSNSNSNSNARANKASDRPDDFVDHTTHFSAMATMDLILEDVGDKGY